MSCTHHRRRGHHQPPDRRPARPRPTRKYKLVLYSAKRARQINAYYSQLGEGLLEYVGPLVDTHVQEKPLSIALREINEDLLTCEDIDPDAAEAWPPLRLLPADATASDASLPMTVKVVLGVSRRHRGVQGLRAAAPVHRVGARRHRRAHGRALEFVGAPTWAALSGKPVATEVWTDVHEVPHVRIGQQADLVVVAPATADLLAKAAHGLADDLLTNTLLTARCPVVFAPAMHTEMWEHPATQANVATLRERGALVIEPAEGRLTGADTGKGRLPDPAEIFELAARPARPRRRRPTAGPRRSHVVVSAGGTREYLDPVRFLGNRSSGLQGYALARTAAARGAEVTLVAANVTPARPGRRQGRPGRDHRAAARRRARAAATADAVVMAAAPADFRPARGQRRQDQEGRRRVRARRSSWRRTPTSSPSSRHDRARDRAGRGRLRRRDRRRRPARCWSTRAPSWRARAATCWSSTTSAGERCSAAPTTRPSSSPPTAAAVDGAARLQGRARPRHLGPRSSPATRRLRRAIAGMLDCGGYVSSRPSQRSNARQRDWTPVHLRVRDRGSPRQDRRPDQRHGPRLPARPTTRQASLASRSRRC